MFKTTRNWFSIVGVSGALGNSADPVEMKIHGRFPGEPQLYGSIDLEYTSPGRFYMRRFHESPDSFESTSNMYAFFSYAL